MVARKRVEPQFKPGVTLLPGDCRTVITGLPNGSIDAVISDPPYALTSISKRFAKTDPKDVQAGPYGRAARGFMGKTWDNGEVAFDPAFWVECLRVLKPGGHLVAFGGTRSHHRMWCAIEDAGFEIRDSLLDLFDLNPIIRHFAESLDQEQLRSFGYILDQLGPGGLLGWLYGSGFPKSHDQGNGWGTALKPAWEPLVLARKPLIGTVAENLNAHGVGALNIDGCRIPTTDALGGGDLSPNLKTKAEGWDRPWMRDRRAKEAHADRMKQSVAKAQILGRWPANLVHDGSDEVQAAFPQEAGGGVSRFYYSSKASAEDRAGSSHPTVKPVDLMRWLVRLVTPKGGVILDPFAGTGSTGLAASAEGMSAILIEREDAYVRDIRKRFGLLLNE